MAEDDDEEELLIVDRGGNDFWTLTAHVQGKEFKISVGDGSQSVKWLSHVAIARWDEDTHQGWKRLGIPVAVKSNEKDGIEIDMTLSIREALQNSDHIYIFTSLQPYETK